MKVAVYGTLRKGQSNNARLSDSKYIGSFESDPEYTMKSIHDSFPGIKKGGNSSIFFEVYEVSLKTLKSIDKLEGYVKLNDVKNYYNRRIIETPWGKAITYLYNSKFTNLNTEIPSGNWVEYLKEQKIRTYA